MQELQITALEPFLEVFDGLDGEFEPAGQGLGLEDARAAQFEQGDEAPFVAEEGLEAGL